MALTRIPHAELTGDYRELVDECIEQAGDARFLEIGANAPHMMQFYFGEFYDKVFFQGVVPVPVKELARLRLSTIHGCAL
jgi:hypothetical protein